MQLQQSALTVGGRYAIINQIGVGGMGVVYRATDRLNGQTVALKRVTVPGNELQFATRAAVTDTADFRLALVREFQVLASLRHPNIISVLDYGFDVNRQPYFTMELLESTQTIVDAGRGKPVAVQLELMMQLLQALAYLHRRGIIHRDLKPDNVMVVHGQVRVLDFGLALVQRTNRDVDATVAGTLAYMAPEILLGKPASPSSDLYAVGVIAYQLFAGRHPFTLENPRGFVNEILEAIPKVDSLPINERLRAMLAQLLSKNQEARYSDADEALHVYAEVTNQQTHYETATIRESFLQTADFVGRNHEFEQLNMALNAALNGTGDGWLIAGESGVGKSRLLDELRTLALVSGMLVLRGQAIVEGGAPYLLWREPLRRLCLRTDLSSFEASVLKPLVPDIGNLLDREIPDAEELDPQATRNRLLSVIEDIFRRQSEPTVLLLEDLHWSSESLDVLARLSRTVGSVPMLIIGSYRDDERPTLSHDLPDMKVMRLGRLPKKNIAELCSSILGAIEHQDQVVDLLERETEGNAFFIVEVLRTLAEEAGQLDQIGNMDLPRRVFSGGMKSIVKRHLSHVPESIRPLLNLAAIAGRELDMSVLRRAAPDGNFDEFLTTCELLSVLEVQENRWRFTHDKLREGLLEGLSTPERQILHRQIASAIEQTYMDDPAQFVVLAKHWSDAGDIANEAKYMDLAGRQAFKNGIYKDAIVFLERSLTLADQTKTSPLRLALLRQQLGEAYFGVGKIKESRVHLESVLALLGSSSLGTPKMLLIGIIRQALQQVWHRIKMDLLRRQPKSTQPPESLLVLARTCERLGHASFISNERNLSLYWLLCGLNLAEQLGSSSLNEQARFYASMTVGAGYVPLHSLAMMYARRAEMLLQTITDHETIVWVMLVRATYLGGRARWEEAEPYINRCMEVARAVGNIRRWEEAAWGSTLHLYYQARWEEVTPLAEELHVTALRQGDLQTQSAIMLVQAATAVRRGDIERALSLINRNSHIPDQSRDGLALLWGPSLLIHIYLRQGEIHAAKKYADDNLATMAVSPPTLFFSLDAYDAVTEYYLTHWETEPDSSDIQKVNLALKYLHQFGRVFDIARPRALIYQSWHDALDGKRTQAMKNGARAINEAQRLQMPYDEGLAHYHLGRFLPQSDPNRLKHLNSAVAIFDRLNATWDAERARLALETSWTS